MNLSNAIKERQYSHSVLATAFIVITALAGCSVSNINELPDAGSVEVDAGSDASVIMDSGDVTDDGGLPPGCCKPGCENKKCGDGDGCGGVCVGSCDSGRCVVESGIHCNVETVPSCRNKTCGEESNRNICNGPCAEGKSCEYGWVNPSCVDCPVDGIPEDGRCDTTKVECACGLDCVAPDMIKDIPGVGVCLKNCSRTDGGIGTCDTGRMCIQWPLETEYFYSNLFNCYQVTEGVSGNYLNCPFDIEYGGTEVSGSSGSAELSLVLEGESLHFTGCAGLYFYQDDNGTRRGPAIVLVDSSHVQLSNVTYYYILGFYNRFYRFGAYDIGDGPWAVNVGTSVMKTTLDDTGAPAKSELIAFGYKGTVTIDTPYLGCDQATAGTITNVTHRLFNYQCKSPDGADCLKLLAR